MLSRDGLPAPGDWEHFTLCGCEEHRASGLYRSQAGICMVCREVKVGWDHDLNGHYTWVLMLTRCDGPVRVRVCEQCAALAVLPIFPDHAPSDPQMCPRFAEGD